RQGLTMSVGDQTAMRRNGNMPHTACVALTFEEFLVEHLQVDDAPGNGTHHQRQQCQHDAETPRIQRALQFHGATSLTSAAAGTCIFNCSLASVSIRLCAVQVLCSRIRRLHSACARSRTLSSAYSSLSS